MAAVFIQQKIGRDKVSELKTIEFKSIPSILENLDVYKNMFIKDGIIAFRNANLSHKDHLKVHDIFGKALGSWRENNETGYTENHSRSSCPDAATKPGPDDIMLPWHIEHPSYENRIVLGTWNMHNFKTDSNNGKTYFVDNKSLYELMPESLKEFAERSIIIDPFPSNNASGKYQLVSSHWLTDEPVITVSHIYRMPDTDTITKNKFPKLHKVDGNDPSESDFQRHFEVIKWIHDQLYSNLDVRLVHRWNQGDLVIPDMSRMCHAVTGGFVSEDREFIGIWGRISKMGIM